MKINSNEKGITLIALVITMIILLILSTITIYTVWGEDGLIEQAQRTQNSAIDSLSEDAGSVNATMQEYVNTMSQEAELPEVPFTPGPTPEPEGGGTEFTMSYGVIEIKWLEGDTYNVSDTPNAPKVKNISNGTMELVKYVESGTTEQERWVPGTDYEYVAVTGTEDNNESRWANARVTIDGIDSYFVWIPRYAYRIVYFNNDTSKNEYKNGTITEEQAIADGKIVGYSDSRGIVTADGKRVDSITSSSNTTHTMVSKDYFMPHPAFLDGTDNGFENGEWDRELEGLWIGKYEASLVNKEDGSNITSNTNILLSANTDKALAVQAGMSSWRFISIGNIYTNALQYSEELESHMLKNSEWGAVAYLTESAYGRNGTEVTQNISSSYITGSAKGSDGNVNIDYTSTDGQKASSTGNVYGIYDLCGGAYEYVAGYYNGNDVSTSNIENGSSFAKINGNSSKFSTAYSSSGSTSESTKQNYRCGDATYEILGWHSDYNYFVYNSNPFFIRGGYCYNATANAGIFYTYFDHRWSW